MRGFSPWPAQIIKPNAKVKRPSIKKPMQYVMFYGCKNDDTKWSAWILESNMHFYEEKKSVFSTKNMTSRFQQAVKEIEEYWKLNKKAWSVRHTVDKQICIPESSQNKSVKKVVATEKSKPKPFDRRGRQKELAARMLQRRKKCLAQANQKSRAHIPLHAVSKQNDVQKEVAPESSKNKLVSEDESNEMFTMDPSEMDQQREMALKILHMKRNRMAEIHRKMHSQRQEQIKGIKRMQIQKKDMQRSQKRGIHLSIESKECATINLQCVLKLPTPLEELVPHLPFEQLSSKYSNHSINYPSVQSYIKQPYAMPPEVQPVDVTKVSSILKDKRIIPTSKEIGFLGLGIMGAAMAKNMLHSGHKVTVWSEDDDDEMLESFIEIGAFQAETPVAAVCKCDIIFVCLPTTIEIKEVFFGGVISQIGPNKGYVQVSVADPTVSKVLSEEVTRRKGRYLEASFIGTKEAAEEGTLIIVTAGDRTLFHDIKSCLGSMAKTAWYIGETVGTASKLILLHNMIMVNVITGLAEVLALAQTSGLSQKALLEIIKYEHGPFFCELIVEKAKVMVDRTFNDNFTMSLTCIKRDLHIALSHSYNLYRVLPTTMAAYESIKTAINSGYGCYDVSSVYMQSPRYVTPE